MCKINGRWKITVQWNGAATNKICFVLEIPLFVFRHHEMYNFSPFIKLANMYRGVINGKTGFTQIFKNINPITTRGGCTYAKYDCPSDVGKGEIWPLSRVVDMAQLFSHICTNHYRLIGLVEPLSFVACLSRGKSLTWHLPK